jgi:hypothetical protein
METAFIFDRDGVHVAENRQEDRHHPGAARVYDDPADLLRHVDAVGVRR